MNISKKHQIIEVFSMIANINYGKTAFKPKALIKNAHNLPKAINTNKILRNFIGTDWKVVWGLAMKNTINPYFKGPPRKPGVGYVTDDAMYVVKGQDPENPAKTLYVVGIAGTNIVSMKAWLGQDLSIAKKVAWGASGQGNISKGIQRGLNHLLNLTPPNSTTKILDFFNGIDKSKECEIAVAGHSLGGALAPVLALKLIEWKEQYGHNNITISCYPSAGPTSGDKQFAEYAATKFNGHYYSIINTRDIVPHAWQMDMYDKLPEIYQPFSIEMKKGSKTAWKDFRHKILGKDYTRILQSTNEQVFTGSYQQDKKHKANQTKEGYLGEAGLQHTVAYLHEDGFNFPYDVAKEVQGLMGMG